MSLSFWKNELKADRVRATEIEIVLHLQIVVRIPKFVRCVGNEFAEAYSIVVPTRGKLVKVWLDLLTDQGRYDALRAHAKTYLSVSIIM